MLFAVPVSFGGKQINDFIYEQPQQHKAIPRKTSRVLIKFRLWIYLIRESFEIGNIRFMKYSIYFLLFHMLYTFSARLIRIDILEDTKAVEVLPDTLMYEMNLQ